MTQQKSTSGNLESALLKAAAAYSVAQFASGRHVIDTENANKRCASADEVLDESEFELSAAGLAYAQAHHHFLVCQRKVKAFEQHRQRCFAACKEAHQRLCTVACSGNRDSILKAAFRYDSELGALTNSRGLMDHARSEFITAQESLKLADEGREAAVQKRDRAKSCAEVAERDRAQAFQAYWESSLSALEAELADAVHRYAGAMGDS